MDGENNMRLIGARGQQARDLVYDASGTIAAGGTSQLILPERKSTSFLFFQNISDTNMYLEMGSARATATLTSGVVTSVTVTNGGFGFTRAPEITFLGGGNTGWNMGNSMFTGCGQPGFPTPPKPAQAIATVAGGIVTAITVLDGGANYAKAPFVFIQNSLNDPYGCADPYFGSAASGVFLPGNSAFNLYLNGTAVATDPLAVYCATTGKAFTCKWMD
jgi:hypothetical protein